MNDRTIKQIAFAMLFIVVLGSAAKWLRFTGMNPVLTNVENPPVAQSEPSVRMHPAKARIAVVQEEAASRKEGVLVKNATTNEEDILDRLRDWARRDPESALNWGQQQPDGPERNEALTDACFQIAQTNPARAVALVERLHLSGHAVLENMAQQWAAKDLTAAYNWLIGQPANDYREAFASGVAFVLAQKEPMDAARFVIQEIPSGSAQDEAVMMVLHQWALADLSGATAWVEQFPAGALQNRAFNELLGVAKYEQSLSQAK